MNIKRNYRFLIYIIIFIMMFGKFLPTFYTPHFIQDIFVTYPVLQLIIVVTICPFVLLYSLINRNEQTLKIFFVLILSFIFGFFIDDKLIDLNYRFIIWVNESNTEHNFKNPILGIKKYKNTKYTEFRTNNAFMVYDSLIYSKNHNLELDKYDSSIHKIYNKDWYWYKYID